jgi:phage tail-like protein
MPNDPSFRHLNRDGRWPDFAWDGLELDADGALRLLALPRLEGALPVAVTDLPAVTTPGGLAVDNDGTIYFSDPVAGRLWRVSGCSGEREPAPCVGGEGPGDTQFAEPTALLIPRRRRVLHVADSGHHRVQLVDPDTLGLRQILTGFDRPLSLASDQAGRLYVIDASAHRVDQLTPAGDVVGEFWTALSQSGQVTDPRAVACEGEEIYVLDGSGAVCAFDPAGTLLDEFDTAIAGAAVFTLLAGVVYVADPGRRRIVVFRRNQAGRFVHAGDAAGYEGPVAALAADLRGGLLVSPGGGVVPLRLDPEGSHRAEGLLWSGALGADDGLPHAWNALHATIALPLGTHLQLFVHTGPAAPPAPVPGDPAPFVPPWRPIALDVAHGFVGGQGRELWIGALFTNDVHGTPRLAQLRLDFDGESYLPYLPAIYRESADGDFLLRYVSLLESCFGELEAEIAGVAALLQPAAAPAETLPWLASFLALSLPETLSADERRRAIASAFAGYARRGTVAGLRDALRREAGVRAVVDEPIQDTGWWALPAPSRSCRPGAPEWDDGADSILGFNTVLAAAEPQGAVVGTTAILDRSQLIAEHEFGSTLFDGVAYRFTVRVYPGEVDCPGKLDQVRAVIEREKPAHTLYEICVVTPGLRIGYRSRLGIDTLVGGGPTPSGLGDGALVLAGSPRGRLGMRSQVGVDTQL